jgi:hypothetical protein
MILYTALEFKYNLLIKKNVVGMFLLTDLVSY